MKISIKAILEAHKARTGERLSLNQIAREMTSEGLFRSFASARGMIYYNTSGKAIMLDTKIIKFLMTRFNIKSMDEIVEQ